LAEGRHGKGFRINREGREGCGGREERELGRFSYSCEQFIGSVLIATKRHKRHKRRCFYFVRLVHCCDYFNGSFFWTGLQDFSGLTGLVLIMIILKNPVILLKIMVRFLLPTGHTEYTERRFLPFYFSVCSVGYFIGSFILDTEFTERAAAARHRGWGGPSG
jgi:hypothetical protein